MKKKIEDEEPEYWILTDYYQLGSLEKYLRTNTVNPLEYFHTSMKWKA